MPISSSGAAVAPIDPLLLAMMEGKRRSREREVVCRLFDALHENNPDRIASFFSEETRFQSLDGTEIKGRDAIWAALQGGAERELIQVTSAGEGCVQAQLRQRRQQEHGLREARLTATLRVRGCKIVHWSESVAR